MKLSLKGFRLVAPFLCCFLFFPMIIHELFILGMVGSTIIVASCTIPGILLFYLAQLFGIRTRRIMQSILSFTTGSLLFLAALLRQLTLDGQSVPTIFILCFILVLQYGIAFIELYSISHASGEENGERFNLSKLITYAGVLFADTVLLIIFPEPVLLYLLPAIYYCIFPVFLPKYWYKDENVNKKTGTKEIAASNLTLISNYFILFITIMLFCLGAFTFQSSFTGWSFVGAGAGAIFYGVFQYKWRLKSHEDLKKIITYTIGSVIVIILFWLIAMDGEIITMLPFLLLNGIIIGFFSTDTLISIKTYPPNKIGSKSTHILFLALIMGIAGFAATMFRWVLRDERQLLPLLLGILIFLLGTGCSFKIIRFLLKRNIPSQKSLIMNKKSRKTRKIRKKIFITIALAALMINPCIMWILHENSGVRIQYTLEKPMYTVDGELISRVNIPAKTGKILFYNDPTTKLPATQPSYPGEYIRFGKNVRLGAYFYDTKETTSDEAISWIASHVDAFSAGGWCGWYLMPENVSYLKANNPSLRFYPMVFATTYWEDPANNITETGGTLTVPYSWGIAWNETMHEMTLKSNDGSEAYGVRHGPGSPYDHLMDLGNQDWADFFAWFFSQRVEEYHANGVAADEVMWNGYWGTNVEDLRDYSSIAEIRETCYQWLERVDNKTDMEIITQAFWPDAQQYQQGVWGEIAFISGNQYGRWVDERQQKVFYESMNWMEIVENMRDIANQNKTYIWAAWYERDNEMALEYAISTYLMGKPNNCSHLVFHPQPVYDGGYPANLAGYYIGTVMEEVEKHSELFDLELGYALGEMYEEKGIGGSLWRRNFDNGIVLVNPYHSHVPGF